MKMMFAVASPMTISPAFTLLKQKKRLPSCHITLGLPNSNSPKGIIRDKDHFVHHCCWCTTQEF